jgi:hypothetical protein
MRRALLVGLNEVNFDGRRMRILRDPRFTA